VYEGALRVEPVKLAELAAAIGTDSAGTTAPLVLWFGPTVAGDDLLVETIGLDLGRALLAGQRYDWERPFRPGETVGVKLAVDDVYEKGANQFAVLLAEFRDDDGAIIHTQHTTFIERGQA